MEKDVKMKERGWKDKYGKGGMVVGKLCKEEGEGLE